MTTLTPDPGLQRERTVLSWSRTSLGLVANAVLLLVRHPAALPPLVSILLAALCLLVASLVLVLAARRRRVLADRARPVRAATASVVPLGVAVTALCVATAAALLVWD